jgi:hypothetical protein
VALAFFSMLSIMAAVPRTEARSAAQIDAAVAASLKEFFGRLADPASLLQNPRLFWCFLQSSRQGWA